MKRLLSILITAGLLLGCANAGAAQEGVTLTRLKETCPESVILTIDGEDYVLPIVLPDGDAIPVADVHIMSGDSSALYDVYPLTEGTYENEDAKQYAMISLSTAPDGHSRRTGYVTSGGQDVVELYWEDPTPENSDLPQTAPAELMQKLLDMCGLSDADLRVRIQKATSAGYAEDDSLYTDAFYAQAGTSFIPNGLADRPFERYNQGSYRVQFAQYLDGVELFGYNYADGVHVEAETKTHSEYIDTVYPGWTNTMMMLSEDDFDASVYLFGKTDVLVQEPLLASLDTVLASIQERIDSGTLKSACELRLGYTLLFTEKPEIVDCVTADYVAVPCWQLVAYDTKDESNRWYDYFSKQPTEYEVRNTPYEVRFNALTGELLTENVYQPVE